MSKVRNYCFTLNNYTPEEILDVDLIVEAKVGITYVCYGVEVGENSTPHLQGYIELSEPRPLSWCKKIDGLVRAHFEPRRGSQSEAITYCKKDGKFFEFGSKKLEREQQNQNLKQERLRNLKRKIEEGATEDEIFELDPVIAVQNDRWVQTQLSKRKPVRAQPLQVLLYYGKPDSGKTHRAYELYPDLYAIPLGKDLWFNGYSGQREVLIDDFCGAFQLKDLLRLLDKWPVLAPVKQSFCWWCPTTIIVTTNVNPSNWYKYEDREDSALALRKRFHGVQYCYKLDNIYHTKSYTIQEIWGKLNLFEEITSSGNDLQIVARMNSRMNASGEIEEEFSQIDVSSDEENL